METAVARARVGNLRQRPSLLPLLVTWALTRALTVLSVAIPVERRWASDVTRYHAVGDALLTGRDVDLWEYPLASLGVTLPPIMLGAETYREYLVLFMAICVALDFVTLSAVLAAAVS